MLNRIVEPAVRAGVGSPRIVPTGLVVLETRGRKTGRLVRSPLAATRIQGHVIVGTFRGDRSQWVRNLRAAPRTRVWVGGRPREVRAFVLAPGKRFRMPRTLPPLLERAASLLAPYMRAGWAFAILAPAAKRAHGS